MTKRTSMVTRYGNKLADALIIFENHKAKYRVFLNDSGTKCVQVIYDNDEQRRLTENEIDILLKEKPSRQVYRTTQDLRLAAGMTQQAFADYFGLQLRSVQTWEYSERNCKEYLFELMEYKLRKEGYIR